VNVYCREAEINSAKCPNPYEIYLIAKGEKEGHQKAAIESYRRLSIALADAIANTVTLFDASVVIGGGLSGAHSLILPTVVEELNKSWKTLNGEPIQRMEVAAYNLHHPDCLADFIKNDDIQITIPGTSEYITYQAQKKIAIGVSRLGSSEAVALGAYAFALGEIKK
jgi:glucokinase